MIMGIPINEDFSYVNPNENTELFIIIQHASDEDFLVQLANKLLDYPCRVFDFFGKYRALGETIFDVVDCERGYTPETVALTSCHRSLPDMARSIYVAVVCEGHDVLILYDDAEIYRRLLAFTRKQFPWRRRRMIPKADK